MRRRNLLSEGETEEVFTISPSSRSVGAQNTSKTYYVDLYINGNPAIGKSASDFTITKSGVCSGATFISSSGRISYTVYGNGGSSSSKSGTLNIKYKETTLSHTFYMSADVVTNITYGSYSTPYINNVGKFWNSSSVDKYGSITNINWISATQITFTYKNTYVSIRASRTKTTYYESGYSIQTTVTDENTGQTGSGTITLTTNSDKTSFTNISGTFSAYSSLYTATVYATLIMYDGDPCIKSDCENGDVYFTISNGTIYSKLRSACAL